MEAPLKGIKVLDFSRYISGPNCGMILGDLGADVVKVEKINGGDESRVLPPMKNGESFYFFALNRNKRSLCIDFRNEEAKGILFELAKKADIIIQNFRPGTIEKMGLGYDEIKKVNKGIIMAQISGFGQTGPYKDKPGFDAIAQAMSGCMSITGTSDGPPMLTGMFVIDYSTSLYTAIGILSALYSRKLTGVGQIVDTTLLDTSISMFLSGIPDQLLNGVTMKRVGNRDRYSAPANTFKTKSGDWIILIAGQNAHFKRFVSAVGMKELLDDERFKTHSARLEHVDEIETIVSKWVGEHSTEDILSIMDDAGVTCSKVEDLQDLVNNPQIKHRNKIVDIEHPTMGSMPTVTSAVNILGAPFEVKYAPPLLGQHTDEVLREWLGISEDKLNDLHQKGIVKSWKV